MADEDKRRRRNISLTGFNLKGHPPSPPLNNWFWEASKRSSLRSSVPGNGRSGNRRPEQSSGRPRGPRGLRRAAGRTAAIRSFQPVLQADLWGRPVPVALRPACFAPTRRPPAIRYRSNIRAAAGAKRPVSVRRPRASPLLPSLRFSAVAGW